MIYVDWAYAGKVATVGVIAVLALLWIGGWLVEFAVYCDMEGQALLRDRGDCTPDEPKHWHATMPARQAEEMDTVSALARFDAALAAMDEPDEHELARYVG